MLLVRRSHLLAPALASYEMERVTGTATVGQEHFGDAIKRAVPVGFTFKGLPQHFVTTDARAIFSAWMQSAVASDILRTKTFKASIAVLTAASRVSSGLVHDPKVEEQDCESCGR